MNQTGSLEHAINLAEAMITSDALWKVDKDKVKDLRWLLRDPKRNLRGIELYADYFRRKSIAPRESNYFRNYELGVQMYRDAANALNGLVQEFKID